MTQEEKQLLIKDLCTRLPYGVKVGFKDSVLILEPRQYDIFTGQLFAHQIYPESSLDTTYGYYIHDYRPYLRPMSSMTKDEFQEYMKYIRHSWSAIDKDEDCYYVKVTNRAEFVDFLNAHHLDYRGLIPMGLALEATEDMYKEE